MIYLQRILLALSLTLLMSAVNAQGIIDGYMKGPKELDVALSFSMENTPDYFAGTTPIALERKINSLSIFGAYGINEKWNIVANAPLSQWKPQDGSIHIKHRFTYSEVENVGRLSLIGAMGIQGPLSNYATETSQAIGQRATVFPFRAVAQFDTKQGIFINACSGYNFSLDPVPSSVSGSVKIGYASAKVYADLWYDVQRAEGGKNYRGTGDLAPNSFRELGVSYQRVGGVLYLPVKQKYGAFVGGAYTFDGRNIGRGYRATIGAVLKLNVK